MNYSQKYLEEKEGRKLHIGVDYGIEDQTESWGEAIAALTFCIMFGIIFIILVKSV